MKKNLDKLGIDIRVEHFAIENIPTEADIIVTHKKLVDRTRMVVKDKPIIAIENYLKDPEVTKLIGQIEQQYHK